MNLGEDHWLSIAEGIWSNKLPVSCLFIEMQANIVNKERAELMAT